MAPSLHLTAAAQREEATSFYANELTHTHAGNRLKPFFACEHAAGSRVVAQKQSDASSSFCSLRISSSDDGSVGQLANTTATRITRHQLICDLNLTSIQNQRGRVQPKLESRCRRQVCLRCVRLHVDTPSFLELQVVCCHHLPLSTSPGTHLHHFAEQLPPPSLALDSALQLWGPAFLFKMFLFGISIQSKQQRAPAAFRRPAPLLHFESF